MLKDKKILIISPHPDDEAIDCGGLVMKAKKEGGQVFVLYMATGGSRQFTTGKGETKEDQRTLEAHKAAKYGGFNHGLSLIHI